MGGSALSQYDWKPPKLFCYYCSFSLAAFQILLNISPKERPPMSLQGFTKKKYLLTILVTVADQFLSCVEGTSL